MGGGELSLVDLDASRKYDFSDESDAHKDTENLVYHELHDNDSLDELYFNIEHSLGSNMVADIGGYHDGKLLAVEIVHSHEDYEAYLRKVKAYHKEKIYDFWIFTEESISKYVNNGVKPSLMIMHLQKRFSRIYYYNRDKKELHAVVVSFKNGEYEWIILPQVFEVSFLSFALAESKYQNYICKEEQYVMDFNVAETEEYIKYREESLKEYDDREQFPSEPVNVFNHQFQFELGKPIRLKFVECVEHPNFHDEVLIVDINGEKWWVANHKSLAESFMRLGHGLLEVTMLSKPNHSIGEYGYQYSAVKVS